jgi:hypothetical protein
MIIPFRGVDQRCDRNEEGMIEVAALASLWTTVLPKQNSIKRRVHELVTIACIGPMRAFI